jgi:hypothetical protein
MIVINYYLLGVNYMNMYLCILDSAFFCFILLFHSMFSFFSSFAFQCFLTSKITCADSALDLLSTYF